MDKLHHSSGEAPECPACSGSENIVCIGTYPAKLSPAYSARLHRCKNCGTVFTWPVNDPEELSRFYADVFNGEFGNKLERCSKTKERIARGLLGQVMRWLPRGGDVLDIGTGLGEWLQLLHTEGLYEGYCGVEFAERMAREAGERCPWASIYSSSAESIREVLGDRKFSLITLIAVIEHLHDPRKVLRYISESLERGGRTVIVYPRIDSYLSRLLGRQWHLFSPVSHLTLYSKKGLSICLEDNGLNVVAARHLWHYYDLQYVISFAVYFYPALKPLLNRIIEANFSRNIGFRLYTGIDILVAER